jgi:hypothetical protein
MLKKILLLFIIPLLFQGCGYSTLYSDNSNKDLNIKVLKTEGDKEINNHILSNLKKYSNKQGQSFLLNINTNYIISDMSKNLKGSVDNYQLFVVTTFEVESNNLKKTIFIRENIKIKNLSDNFEKRNYEKSIKKNFGDSITNKLILQLSTLK